MTLHVLLAAEPVATVSEWTPATIAAALVLILGALGTLVGMLYKGRRELAAEKTRQIEIQSQLDLARAEVEQSETETLKVRSNADLELAQKQSSFQEGIIKQYESIVGSLHREIDRIKTEMAGMRASHSGDLDRMQERHSVEIERMQQRHTLEVDRLRQEQRTEIARLRSEHEAEVRSLRDELQLMREENESLRRSRNPTSRAKATDLNT